jgi:protein involved in polysaccharide export with SLBB domain
MEGRKMLAYLGLIFFLPCLVSCTSSQQFQNPDQAPPSQALTEVKPMAPYVLEIGDEVSIRIWGFDELKRNSVMINNSGEIYFPLIGSVKLAGKTVPEAKKIMVAALKEYIVDPQVELTTSTNRQQVFIFGEVNHPSTISYRRPLLVVEAIAKAGWFNLDANRKTVLVVRKADNKFHVFSVNVGDLFQNGSRVPEFYLQGGDLVYVFPSGIVKLERFLQHIQTMAQPFLTVEQAVVLWPQFVDALRGKTTAPGLAIGTTAPSPTTPTSTTTTTPTTTH